MSKWDFQSQAMSAATIGMAFSAGAALLGVMGLVVTGVSSSANKQPRDQKKVPPPANTRSQQYTLIASPKIPQGNDSKLKEQMKAVMENLKDAYTEDADKATFVTELEYAIADLNKVLQMLQVTSSQSNILEILIRVIKWYKKIKRLTGPHEGEKYLSHSKFVDNMQKAIRHLDDPTSTGSLFIF